MDSGADSTGEAFDETLLKKPRLDAGSQLPPPASVWADILPDILGVVLRFLPCLADRARVRSVCPRWRAAAFSLALPPPLPLIVLPKLQLSCLTSDKELMTARSPLVPEGVAADDARYVGSYDGWLVGVTPINGERKYHRQADDRLFVSVTKHHCDGGCFLANVFSRRVVCLPHLCRTSYTCAHLSCKILPVVNGSGDILFEINGWCTMSLRKVVLSAPPDSGSKYIVAASSDHMYAQIALWQPGMTSWHVCTGVPLDGPKDIAFYKGKLYVLQRFSTHLFAFVLEEDDCGIVISRVEQCMTELLPPHHNCMEQDNLLTCNMVVWRENLLLIARYYNAFDNHEVIYVEVFALDFSTNPYGLTRISSFDGDCIFIGSGSSKSFPASMHDGVEGDLIYFVPDYWSPYDRFVYNVRNRRMRPFSVKFLPYKGMLDDPFPMWLFPSE